MRHEKLCNVMVRLPKQIHDEICVLAEDDLRTITSYISMLVKKHIKEKELERGRAKNEN